MGLVDKIKDLTGFGEIEYEDEFEEEMEEEAEEKPVRKIPSIKKNRVVPIAGENAYNRIVVLKPKCFNSSTEVADQIKQRRPVILDVGGIDPWKKVNEITREERKTLLNVLKDMRFKVVSLRPIEGAIITSGGINVKEINPKTMESKLCRGLYFAGEVIDVDAYTGGFNLQIAFSTGYLAGMNA